MPKAKAIYRLEWDPPPRLMEEIRRRGYGAPWEMPYEAYRRLHDDLTLAEGRVELERWARAIHAEDSLPEAMEKYGQDFAYEIPHMVTWYRGINPDKKIAIHRAVGKDMPDVIKPGDWVAIERKYAVLHGRGGFGDHGGSKILTAMVPARDVAWAGTSADEWLFAPQEFRSPDVGVYDALLEYARAQGYIPV